MICYVCQHSSVEMLLDFGSQPLSNRFLSSPDQEEFLHPLLLGYCHSCGLIQLINPVSCEEAVPRFDWIRYQEPEGHLDRVAEILSQLPGVTSESTICGISGQETSLLTRLRQKGFTHTWQLSLGEDLGVHLDFANVETIQKNVTLEKIEKVVKSRGRPNVVIARYILEHAHDPLQFMTALQSMVQSDGYVVFEVPDVTTPLRACDYSILWEEHVFYFTPYSFIKCLEMGGFEVHSLDIYPYTMENSMVIIARIPDGNRQPSFLSRDGFLLEDESQRAFHYAKMLTERSSWYKEILSHYRQESKIALLGAGHLACHFINLLQLADLIDFVIDDHPNKSGMFMPGSKLPIFPSTLLEERKIKVCLLSLSPESERKVINHKKDFLARGGKFFSIFSTSDYALKSRELTN
ncbi:MAG: hypothetical protein A3F11_03270 [Gammaproteobacteria bacterium RIFCSPHIGHO2_12_FULL_37_14]|nr:MAG: hypothetical protein A3F11_03270 [Gammaproteobacteria bacterium RIFCSPHIGHO2_12_FULL_37_14]